MALIDYSNISSYNITALTQIEKFSDLFFAVDRVFSIDYLFGTISLVIIFTSILLMYKDYDIKVGLLTSSLITLFIAFGYYFTGLIAWQHLLTTFSVLVLVVLMTFKWAEE